VLNKVLGKSPKELEKGQGSIILWNYCTNANNDKNVWNANAITEANYWAVHRGGPDWPRFKSKHRTDSHLSGHESMTMYVSGVAYPSI